MASNDLEWNEINSSDDVLQFLAHLCMNEDHADVTFIVENQRIPAHRVIVAKRCSYFDTLLNGSYAESTQSEKYLHDVQLDAFHEILRYVYIGRLFFVGLDLHQIFQVCVLADLYGLEALKNVTSQCLVSRLSVTNCCEILDAALVSHSFHSLQEGCMQFMDRNSKNILANKIFRKVSKNVLLALLKRDSFYAPEIEIFKAVRAWLTHNSNGDIKEIIGQIRWSLLSMDDLLTIVLPSNLVDDDDMVNIMNERKNDNVKGNRIKCYSQSLIIERDSFEVEENGLEEEDDEEIAADTRDRSSLLWEAKRLKHSADREYNSFAQAEKYLEVCLLFLLTGVTMEQDSQESAFTMYKDTLSLLTYIIAKFKRVSFANHHQDSIFNILCLRCQSILNCKLYKMQYLEMKPGQKIVEEYLNLIGNSTTSASLQPITTSGSIDHVISESVSVPTPILVEIQRQSRLNLCYVQWENANVLMKKTNHQTFFKELDVKNGAISFNSPVRQSVSYIRAAIRKLYSM